MLKAFDLFSGRKTVQGLSPLLSSLKQSGMIPACLTNDDESRAGEVLRHLGVLSFFGLILGGDGGNPERKIFRKRLTWRKGLGS